MKFFQFVGLLLLTLLWGCASVVSKDANEISSIKKISEFSNRTRTSFDLGKKEGLRDQSFVDIQEDFVLADDLLTFYDPFAGARRLLDLLQRYPSHPLIAVYLPKPTNGVYFSLQQEENFKSGSFFNSYEKTLFDGFYRQALLEYVQKPEWTEAEFERLSLALKEAARLTPRYGEFYPIDLSPKTRGTFNEYLAKYPSGPISDRFRFFLILDENLDAWGSMYKQNLDRLAFISSTTQSELLKEEIADLLNAERLDPARAFTCSLLLPGLGQVLNGDVQGGVLMAGITAAAWWWTLSRLVAGLSTGDPTTRQAALGDAAWGTPLIALAHGFAATNAYSQARFFNILIDWDFLSKARLTKGEEETANH